VTDGLEETSRAVIARLNVSRETAERLTTFVALVTHWTPRINLVSRASLPDLWTRHILDSAQLCTCAPVGARHWLDIGAGAGFPGLVCAILAQETRPALRFTLVESDRRKCTFLRTVARETGLNLTIHASRIEALPPQEADVVTARAVAPLADLFRLAAPHATPDAVLLFPKGARHDDEIAEARAHWRFTVEARPSLTNPSARILICRDLSPL
jgi:16S rRNA (guanine527-N7)-methyltransferase